MRWMSAAGSAIVVCLGLGVPALAQSPTNQAGASPSDGVSPGGPTAPAIADRTNVSGKMDGGAVKETPIVGERAVLLSFEFTYAMSDPRVTGTEKMDCPETFYDLPELSGGVAFWLDCTSVLTGQGGTWKGVTGFGSEYMKDGEVRTNGANLYEGQGAFAGLRYVSLISVGPETSALSGDGYIVAGWIEPME